MAIKKEKQWLLESFIVPPKDRFMTLTVLNIGVSALAHCQWVRRDYILSVEKYSA